MSTEANTDDRLYLCIQATSPQVIDKILAGGIAFTISSADKNNYSQPVKVTFPLISVRDRSSIVHQLKDPEVTTDEELRGLNNKLVIASKEIECTGINELTDSLFSVYNAGGIKAIGRIDNNKAYEGSCSDYTQVQQLPRIYLLAAR